MNEVKIGRFSGTECLAFSKRVFSARIYGYVIDGLEILSPDQISVDELKKIASGYQKI